MARRTCAPRKRCSRVAPPCLCTADSPQFCSATVAPRKGRACRGSGTRPAELGRRQPRVARLDPRQGGRVRGERQVVVVEDERQLGPRRERLPHDHVGLTDLGLAVVPPAVDPEAADAAHEPRAAVVVAVDPELLPPVAVAAPLQVGAYRQPPRRIDLGDEADHPAGGVAVEDRARAADDLDAPHRPEVDVARLGGPVGGGQRYPVLDDGEPADAEVRLGRRGADAQGDAAGQPVVAPVLDGQARDATQRLVERRLPLAEAERLGSQHRHRVGHVVETLIGPRHGDGLGQRRDRQGDVDDRLRPRHRRRGGVAAEPGENGGHLVVSRGQPRDLVAADVAGHGAARQAGRVMPNGHRHPGQQSAELVGDDAPDRAGVVLRRRRGAEQDEAARRDESGRAGGSGCRNTRLPRCCRTPSRH